MRLRLLLALFAGVAWGQQPITVLDTAGNSVRIGSAADNAARVLIVGGAGSGGTSSNYGAAFPGAGTAVGFSDGVNMQPGLVDGSGFLKVNCSVGCSGSSFADNSAFTFGTTAISVAGFVFDDVAPNAATENRAAAPRMSGNRVPYSQLRDAAGNERGANVNASNQLTVSVDNTVTVASHAVTNAGTFAVQNTANASTNVTQWAGTATDVNSGTKSAGTLRVVLATDQPALTNKLLVTPDSVALPANQSVNVAQLAGTATDTNSGSKSAGTLRVVLATDQPALTNKLLVTPDSVALPANQSTNVNQLAGTTTDTNSGTKSAGTLRVVLATDQPALTNKLLVTPDSVALPANQSVNVAQINGVTTTMGNGASGTGVQRVTLANDSTGVVAGTLANNGAAIATNRFGTLPAIARTNLPAAYTTGRDAALTVDVSGIGIVSQLPSAFTTYAASKQGLVPASSPTDVAVLPGNATNTVIVTGVTMSCTQTTAGIIDVQLIKRSSADTSGTSGAMTIVPLDSGNAAAVSAPLTYTANPTINGTVGNVDTQKIGVMAAATASPNDIYVWRPGMGQSVVLRGTAQQLAVNLNGVTLTGGSCDISYQWVETTGL